LIGPADGYARPVLVGTGGICFEQKIYISQNFLFIHDIAKRREEGYYLGDILFIVLKGPTVPQNTKQSADSFCAIL
jgi:hypothetical protein